MFKWMGGKEAKEEVNYDNILQGLKAIYKEKLLPLEEAYQFHDFHTPKLDDADFDAKPMILLIGQYSTGKTTFIKYLLDSDFPGMRIGPEPTTDKFIAVMHDAKETIIPGNALVVDPKKQYRPLAKYGNAFLNRFQCSTLPNSVLKQMSIVDTPGILSGEKQRLDRGYDFTGVLQWFAERVDRILLLFDAHKLDISDEFRRSIEALKGHDDKVRIVLNKADSVDPQKLMRVYGALMWSLGKVLQTPEVARVYIGSFWSNSLQYADNRNLFDAEQQDLIKDLLSLPRSGALRKLNDLIKRARLAKVHAYIISELRKDMPTMFGKENKKKELIKNLQEIYNHIEKVYQVSPGDLPPIQHMKDVLAHHDFTKFNLLKPKLIENVDKMMAVDIANLMRILPQENGQNENLTVSGGIFGTTGESSTPFSYGKGEGVNSGADSYEWIVEKDKYEYDTLFEGLNPVDGKLTGEKAREEMLKSNLPRSTLRKIWNLADVDGDGQLDSEEFALAMHLVRIKRDDHELPETLPSHLVPPSKRK